MSVDGIEAKSERYERAIERSRKRAIDELKVDRKISRIQRADGKSVKGNSVSRFKHYNNG